MPDVDEFPQSETKLISDHFFQCHRDIIQIFEIILYETNLTFNLIAFLFVKDCIEHYPVQMSIGVMNHAMMNTL